MSNAQRKATREAWSRLSVILIDYMIRRSLPAALRSVRKGDPDKARRTLAEEWWVLTNILLLDCEMCHPRRATRRRRPAG